MNAIPATTKENALQVIAAQVDNHEVTDRAFRDAVRVVLGELRDDRTYKPVARYDDDE